MPTKQSFTINISIHGQLNLVGLTGNPVQYLHDYVIKRKNFPRDWPFVRGIYRSSMDSPDKGQ